MVTVGLALACASLAPAGRRLPRPVPPLPAALVLLLSGLGAYPAPPLTLIQATASMVAR